MSNFIVKCMECGYFGSEREMNKIPSGGINCPKCAGDLHYPTRWETEAEMEEEFLIGCLLVWDKECYNGNK